MEHTRNKQSPNMDGNDSGSWVRYWDGDESSICGLTLDHSRELHNLVEDKDIAARAVAFVVNSTRKGIVPLCADVASLLRTKRRLENKIFRLRGDNDKLRASLSESSRTSNCTSPTPASIHSCDNHNQSQCSQCYCSDCSSQCDSIVSNSPKLDKSFSPRSPCLRHTSAFTAPLSYQSSRSHDESSAPRGEHNSIDGISPPLHSHEIERTHSLPEIVCEPSAHLVRVRPTVSTEVQCTLQPSADSPSLELQFRETLQQNARLAEQLGAAKQEIELLKGKLKELEMNQLAREYMDRYHMENEVVQRSVSPINQPKSLPSNQSVPRNPPLTVPRNQECCPSDHELNTDCIVHYSTTGTVKRKCYNAVVIASPLEGCICTQCHAQSLVKPHSLYTAENRLKVEVLLNDHVVIKGEKTGHVRYLGHLDGVGQPQVVFAGIELDAPVGRHDGLLNGHRYFCCQKDSGIFVPLHEVCCVITQKVKVSKSCDHSKPIKRGVAERSPSNQDLRSSFSKTIKKEKEKRYTPSETDLKLPKNTQFMEGHLV